MRIALFCGNYNYLKEGANQALNRLVDHCEREGDTVRVYSPVTDTPAFEPAGTLVPVRSVTLPVRSEFQLALGVPRAIRADVRRFAPDLVHVSTPDILNTRAQSFAKRLGLPVVASFHTRFETYFKYYGIGWARPLGEAHLRRFYRRSDLVLAPNEAIAAEMRLLVGADRILIWSRGIDRDLFTPARRDEEWRRGQGWSDEDVVLLFFGRLVIEKGVGPFIETVQRLRADGRRFRVLVVGDGPAANLFAAIPDAVRTGHLQEAALASAVASADILLQPSVTEAFGNVVLEAMAAGLAVVAADAPSAAALIHHERTGLLCPPEPAAYAAAVARLLDSPDERRRLGTAARAASAAFSWESASAAARGAYLALLDRSGSAVR